MIGTWMALPMKSKSMLTTQVHAQVHAQFAIGIPNTILAGGVTNASSAITALGSVGFKRRERLARCGREKMKHGMSLYTPRKENCSGYF